MGEGYGAFQAFGVAEYNLYPIAVGYLLLELSQPCLVPKEAVGQVRKSQPQLRTPHDLHLPPGFEASCPALS